MARVFRIFAYLYQLAVCLAFLALAVVALAGGASNLRLPMFPWKGEALPWWLAGLSLAGILVTLLAMFGKWRLWFPVWCGYVLWRMLWWLFLSPEVAFSGRDEFTRGLWLLAGAIVAFLASLTLLNTRAR